jgi:PiT family inorganic phosphate transporter
MGIPISTTHAAASSITGSGVASGQGVNLRVVMEMVAAWVITIPATVIIGWLMYQFTQLPGAAAWIAVGSVLLVLSGWIAWAMARALHASDVAAEIPTDEQLREPVSAIPHIEGHAPVA